MKHFSTHIVPPTRTEEVWRDDRGHADNFTDSNLTGHERPKKVKMLDVQVIRSWHFAENKMCLHLSYNMHTSKRVVHLKAARPRLSLFAKITLRNNSMLNGTDVPRRIRPKFQSSCHFKFTLNCYTNGTYVRTPENPAREEITGRKNWQHFSDAKPIEQISA